MPKKATPKCVSDLLQLKTVIDHKHLKSEVRFTRVHFLQRNKSSAVRQPIKLNIKCKFTNSSITYKYLYLPKKRC